MSELTGSNDLKIKFLSIALDILRTEQGEANPLQFVEIGDRDIVVVCRNQVIGQKIYEKYILLGFLPFGLRIEIEGETPTYFPPRNNPTSSRGHKSMIGIELMQDTRSEWLKQEKNMILLQDYVEDRGTVSIHSSNSDAGYPCLEVQPFLGLHTVLNRKRADMLGQPCEVAGFIGAKKREAIEQAIACKGRVKVFYEWRWGETESNKRKWEMCLTAMVQGDEVLVISENFNIHQKQYWRDIAKGID